MHLLLLFVGIVQSITKHFKLMFSGQEILNVYDGTFNMMITSDDSRHGFDLLSNRISPSAFYNAGHEFELPKCHPGTRVAVLDRLKNWILGRGPNSSILWLYGAAGSGKSSVARSIAEWCESHKLLLASFFFLRSDSTRNNPRRFVPTLAYNITQTYPIIRSSISKVVELDPHLFSKSLLVQFKFLVVDPLSSVAQTTHDRPYVLVIDGLDECLQEEGQKAILRLFSENQDLGMKVLIASRPEHAIQSSFEGIPMQYIHTRLALSNEYEATKDIRRFLGHKFSEIKQNHRRKAFIPLDWPSTEDMDKLVTKSSGQFIYAATIIKYLSSDRHNPTVALRSILGDISPPVGRQDLPFSELDAVYAYVLQIAGERVHSLEAVLRVIALIVISINRHYWSLHREIYPTPIAMLADVLTLDVEMVGCILMDLGSIISCSDRGVYAYHASLGDFIFDRTRSGGFWVNKPAFLSDILCRCLSMLPSLSRKSCIIWSILSDAMVNAQPTPAISRSMLSFDFVGSLNRLSPLTSTESDFLHCIEFLYALSTRIMDVKDWEQPYDHLVSTFDLWIANKLFNCSKKSPILTAQVASLCCHWNKGLMWRIYDLKLYSNLFPLEYPDIFCRGHALFDDFWFAFLFEKRQLPHAQAHILDPETLASGVLLCIHLLLQSTITDSIFRFVNTKQQKSLPWLWRKRTHWRRVGRYGRNVYPNFLGFREIIHIALHLSYPYKRKELWLYTISAVLEALPQLLSYRPVPSRIVFALRLVLSLQYTHPLHASRLHNVKEAIIQYLGDVGLKQRSGIGLAYVNVF